MYASSVAVPRVRIDLAKKSQAVRDFETSMRSRVVNQDAAVDALVRTYQLTRGGIQRQGKPYGILLFAGPTGVGKTFVFETAAEALFGSPSTMIKIDCAEFQHSHEIAKLIGSPPGYLGHRETPPLLTQQALDMHHTDRDKLSFVFFDEVEKGNEALWQLMLGIMDKGTLTLGDNRKVDLTKCIIGMSTNLGASEMRRLSEGSNCIGLVKPVANAGGIQSAALGAVYKNFSPEFMNRVDEVVVFNTHSAKDMLTIATNELIALQRRVGASKSAVFFVLRWTNDVIQYLLERSEKTESYGARPLKRVIEKEIAVPLSIALSTNQITDASTVLLSVENGNIVFDVLSSKTTPKI